MATYLDTARLALSHTPAPRCSAPIAECDKSDQSDQRSQRIEQLCVVCASDDIALLGLSDNYYCRDHIIRAEPTFGHIDGICNGCRTISWVAGIGGRLVCGACRPWETPVETPADKSATGGQFGAIVDAMQQQAEAEGRAAHEVIR